MKVNTKIIALMTALAVGTAAAAAPAPNTTNTVAGTEIDNIASASFTDPTTGNTTASVNSNTVSTFVLPLPGFDIVYADGTNDGNTLSNTPKVVTGATPGQVNKTDYSVVNNGNVPLTVQIAANTSGSAAGETVTYLDASGNALPSSTTNGVTTYTVSLPAGSGGIVKITQVITLPTSATPNTDYGASPEGSVVGTGTDTGQNGIPSGSTLYENQTVTTSGNTTTVNATPAQGSDLQYVKLTTFSPNLSGGPNDPNAPKPTAPDGTTAATPVALTTVNIPTVASGTTNSPNPTNTAQGYASTPSNPNDPTSGGTPIVPDLAGNIQTAYPKADNDNNPSTPNANGQTNDQPGTPDTIYFTNEVKNNSGSSDSVQLFPAGPDGKPQAGMTFDASTGIFTLSDGTQVIFLGPNSGKPIPVASGATYPTMVVPAGSTGLFRTEVIMPDPSDSALINPLVVKIGIDSLNDAGINSDASTTDKVMPAAAQFGDSTPNTLGAVPTPGPVQTVVPSNNTSSSIDTTNATDNVAVFPMDVANMGTYNDSYTLSATVANLPAGATITYVDSSGAALPTNGAGNYITPVVGSQSEITVYAVVTVPAGTAAGQYVIKQKAVGDYSTITMTDLNDVIQVGAVGNVKVAKFVQDGKTAAGSTPVNGINNPANFTANNTKAQPMTNVVYQIIGKNNYNSPVSNFSLNDTVPANTTFQSVGLTVNGSSVSKVIYKVGTGTWSATAPAAGLASGTAVAVAADTDNDGAPDVLSAGSTMEMTFTVKIN